MLLVLYLLGTTEAYQLLKTPLLVNHYLKHKQENNHITFLKFIQMHYTGDVVYDDDYAQDMQLPFKTHEVDACCLFSVSLPVSPIEIATTTVHYITTLQPSRNIHFKLSNHSFDIFQPPKKAFTA